MRPDAAPTVGARCPSVAGMGRILLFGATGYTGRLVASALASAPVPVTLAGRNADRLSEVAAEAGADATLVADASDGEALRDALEPGDVLVSTVGPFVRLGHTALRAAISSGAHYLDSTGEPSFVRSVFAEGADAPGCLLTAFGYDYVPGNLAGALALEEAGPDTTALEVGYFVTGRSDLSAVSSGTLASIAGIAAAPSHAFRDGRLRRERAARRIGVHVAGGQQRRGVSVGGTEHLALPRLHPGLRDVDVHLGWAGPLSRAVQVGSAVLAGVTRIPGVRGLIDAATAPLAGRTGEGPGPDERERTGSLIAGRALGADGAVLATVELRGANAYSYTGDILAWGAVQLATRGPEATGAVGPVEAFGLATLEAGCAAAGLHRTV